MKVKVREETGHRSLPTPSVESGNRTPGPSLWGLLAGWVGILLLATSVGAVAALFLTRNQLGGLKDIGYLGVAIIAFLGNVPVIPVFPWLVLIAPLSGVYPMGGLVIAGALGAGLGEGLPYLTASTFCRARRNNSWMKRLASLPGWVRLLAILVLSLSPMFSFPGLAAGILRVPFWMMIIIKIATEGLKLWLVLAGVSMARQALMN